VQNTSEYKNVNNVRNIIHYALNMVLDGTVEKEDIIYHSKQIGAYAYDIVLVQEINKSRKKYYLHWKTKEENWLKN
jgi:exonuclease III